MKNLILASTSTLHGSQLLEYIYDELKVHFSECEEILFIPFARPGGITHDEYNEKITNAFKNIGKSVKGLHECSDPISAIENAKGIFTGGGNTFVLINQLYRRSLIEPLKNALNNGVPYLGTSAGTNICGLSIGTTNDMPIVYPQSFDALKMVPFNINPHYIDPDPSSTHMGETRETRINEFHKFNDIPVVGLREGSFIEVKNEQIFLRGRLAARIFENDKTPYEIETNSSLIDLKKMA
jgi:dipeptidase E